MAWIECEVCGEDFSAPFKGMKSGVCINYWKAERDAARLPTSDASDSNETISQIRGIMFSARSFGSDAFCKSETVRLIAD